MFGVPRDKTHPLDVNPTLPLLALALAAIALADVAAAGWAAAFLCPAMLLATRGRARIRASIVCADTSDPRAPDVSRAGAVLRIEIEGPLLFLSVPSFDRLFASARKVAYVIVDLRGVSSIDASALFALRELLERLDEQGIPFLLVCAPDSPAFHGLTSVDLLARALGGTSCFTHKNALARIAARHPPALVQQDCDAVARAPRLHLVRMPAPSRD